MGIPSLTAFSVIKKILSAFQVDVEAYSIRCMKE